MQADKSGMLRTALQWPGKVVLKHAIGDAPFTIISNDCFGAEVYRWLDRAYNTPFVGLMIMAPCYLDLLENFEPLMKLNISFIQHSKYKGMNEFRARNSNYPLGLLGASELHFLHYKSEADAAEKWVRRRDRMDWKSLRFKFSMEKDYAVIHHAYRFNAFTSSPKICIGSKPIEGISCFTQIPNLVEDGAAAFQQSLRYINIPTWLKSGRTTLDNPLEIMRAIILNKSLKW